MMSIGVTLQWVAVVVVMLIAVGAIVWRGVKRSGKGGGGCGNCGCGK